MSFFTGSIALLFALAAVMLYFILYAVATAIDVYLAIEFNTRAEKVGKGL
jgi:hypothetical protein